MGIVAWIVLGLCAGLVARALTRTRGIEGLLATTIAGILGAVVGGAVAGVLFNANPVDEFFDVSTWLTAIAGSVLLLWIYRMLVGDQQRDRLYGQRRRGLTS